MTRWSSTVTLVLSCPVSEILKLSYAKSHFFQYLLPLWTKFWAFLFKKTHDVGVYREKKPRQMSHEIIFEVFQPM